MKKTKIDLDQVSFNAHFELGLINALEDTLDQTLRYVPDDENDNYPIEKAEMTAYELRRDKAAIQSLVWALKEQLKNNVLDQVETGDQQ